MLAYWNKWTHSNHWTLRLLVPMGWTANWGAWIMRMGVATHVPVMIELDLCMGNMQIATVQPIHCIMRYVMQVMTQF